MTFMDGEQRTMRWQDRDKHQAEQLAFYQSIAVGIWSEKFADCQ
jgi:hypothetical protein